MSFFPYNPNVGQRMQTDSGGVYIDRAFIAHLALSAAQAAAASTTAVHAAVTDTGVQQVVRPGCRSLCPQHHRHGGRAPTSRPSGHVEGTDLDNNCHRNPAHLHLDTAGRSSAIKPKDRDEDHHPGARRRATTAIGFGDKISLPDKLAHNTVLLPSEQHEGRPA
jgi:hypothetical protein